MEIVSLLLSLSTTALISSSFRGARVWYPGQCPAVSWAPPPCSWTCWSPVPSAWSWLWRLSCSPCRPVIQEPVKKQAHSNRWTFSFVYHYKYSRQQFCSSAFVFLPVECNDLLQRFVYSMNKNLVYYVWHLSLKGWIK